MLLTVSLSLTFSTPLEYNQESSTLPAWMYAIHLGIHSQSDSDILFSASVSYSGTATQAYTNVVRAYHIRERVRLSKSTGFVYAFVIVLVCQKRCDVFDPTKCISIVDGIRLRIVFQRDLALFLFDLSHASINVLVYERLAARTTTRTRVCINAIVIRANCTAIESNCSNLLITHQSAIFYRRRRFFAAAARFRCATTKQIERENGLFQERPEDCAGHARARRAAEWSRNRKTYFISIPRSPCTAVRLMSKQLATRTHMPSIFIYWAIRLLSIGLAGFLGRSGNRISAKSRQQSYKYRNTKSASGITIKQLNWIGSLLELNSRVDLFLCQSLRANDNYSTS